jgi:16S rRNA (guanine966-N2)-methyltransferase
MHPALCYATTFARTRLETTMSKHKKPYANSKHSASNAKRNTLRIVGGKWRGRQLQFPSELELRPTGDRIRETLFNWLAPQLPGAHCLDLFSGSGALGFEAISRGGASATLVEQSETAYRALREHRATLDEQQQITLINTDALQWLQNEHNARFDIVFLDPPFQGDFLPRTLELLTASPIVNSGALVYLECALDQPCHCPANWRTLRSKDAGHVRYSLLEIGE